MLIQYGEIGCIDAQVKCEPRFTDQLGVVDLVYSIEEREPFSLGELEIVGNDRTKDKVIRREAVMAGCCQARCWTTTGSSLFRRRLARLGYFMNNPQQGKQIKIDIVRQRPSDQPYGDVMTPYLQDVTRVRGCKTPAPAPTWCPRRRRFLAEHRPHRLNRMTVPLPVRHDAVRPAGQFAARRRALGRLP